MQVACRVVGPLGEVRQGVRVAFWNNSGYEHGVTDAAGYVHLQTGEWDFRRLVIDDLVVAERTAWFRTPSVVNGLQVNVILKR
jgi:hypothetical protein